MRRLTTTNLPTRFHEEPKLKNSCPVNRDINKGQPPQNQKPPVMPPPIQLVDEKIRHLWEAFKDYADEMLNIFHIHH